MRALIVNDIHASKHPPSSCTDSYCEDLLDLLEQTVVIQRNQSVQAVVWAGDVFHHKGPSRTPHSLVQHLISIGQSYRCPWFIVPGNHDLAHDRLESVGETQPLGVLFRAGARVLNGWAWEHFSDVARQMPLYGFPWLQHWTDEAVSDSLAAYRKQVLGAGTGSQKVLVVAHAPLYPPGKELQFEYYPAVKFAEAMGGAGFCAFGHVHEPSGVWRAGGVTFCNHGALSRGSLHEYNITRQVGVTFWDSDSGEFSFVPLNAKPADQVFRLREKQQVTDMAGRLDDFLADISHTSLEAVSIESVMARLQATGADAGTLSLAEELLAHGSAAAK